MKKFTKENLAVCNSSCHRIHTFALAVAIGFMSLPVLGQQIFVLSANGFYAGSGLVDEYNLNGTPADLPLIGGLSYPDGLAVSGGNIFLCNIYNSIAEFSSSGTLENPALIGALSMPEGASIAISGSDLFVGNVETGVIGEYTTSGAPVNTSLITGLSGLEAIAVSGGNLYVDSDAGIGKYTTAGAVVNASLITGVNDAVCFAVSGSQIFIGDGTDGLIAQYTTSGTLENSGLITGLAFPDGIAISGSDLFVINYSGTVGEYTTSGGTVNGSLITGLNDPVNIVVASVPEPSAVALAGVGAAALWLWRRRK